MAHRVTWSPRAVEDLEAIARYIAVDSSAYAAAVVKTVLATTRKVSKFPFAGRVVPEFKDENTREWFAYSYRIIYRIVHVRKLPLHPLVSQLRITPRPLLRTPRQFLVHAAIESLRTGYDKAPYTVPR